MSKVYDGMDVGYLAKLACINLTETEKTAFQAQLEQVLRYVEQLNEPDVSGIKPTTYTIPVCNIFRKDKPESGLHHAGVIANAPSADGKIRVPKIIDRQGFYDESA